MLKTVIKWLGFTITENKPAPTPGSVTIDEVRRMADDFVCDVEIDGDSMMARFKCKIAHHMDGRPFDIGTLNLRTREWKWA
jgi:hypothetical protein